MAHEITITSYISVFSSEMTRTLPFKNHRNQKTEVFFHSCFSPQLGAPFRKLNLEIITTAPWFKITGPVGNHQIFRNSGQGTRQGKIGRNMGGIRHFNWGRFEEQLRDVCHFFFCSSHVTTMYVHCGKNIHHGPEIFHSNSFNKASKIGRNTFQNMCCKEMIEELAGTGFISKRWIPKIHLFCIPVSQMFWVVLDSINSIELLKLRTVENPLTQTIGGSMHHHGPGGSEFIRI